MTGTAPTTPLEELLLDELELLEELLLDELEPLEELLLDELEPLEELEPLQMPELEALDALLAELELLLEEEEEEVELLELGCSPPGSPPPQALKEATIKPSARECSDFVAKGRRKAPMKHSLFRDK